MQALHSVSPDMVPEPVNWGTLEANPDAHFFICKYVEMTDELPDPYSFCRKLADLHRRSMEMSLNGKFGFDVTTCRGTYPQDNEWNDSWEAFFSRQTRNAFKWEVDVQGRCEEYDKLLPPFFEKVIPRLLRPLETGDNVLRPVLVHGEVQTSLV